MTARTAPTPGGTLADALTGVVAVLVTAYRDGAVDAETCARLAQHCADGGVTALTVLGNTAEVHQLTGAERRTVLTAVRETRGDVGFIAGVAGAAAEVVQETAFAARLGYDAVMVHEPPDPFGDSAGLVAYYAAVADRAALPVLLYVRTPTLSTEGLAELAAHPNVAGVKLARAVPAELAALLTGPVAGSCTWINGSAELTQPAFAGFGVTGFTSGIAVARPDVAVALHAAFAQADAAAAGELLRLVAPVERLRALHRGRHNVAVIKELLRREGIDAGPVRPPHAGLDDATSAALHAAVDRWPAAPERGSAG